MRDSTKAEHGADSPCGAFTTSPTARVGTGTVAGPPPVGPLPSDPRAVPMSAETRPSYGPFLTDIAASRTAHRRPAVLLHAEGMLADHITARAVDLRRRIAHVAEYVVRPWP
jgi:hypothetical protein